MQNEATSADDNPATSDALFVVQTGPAVAVGNRMRISGAVQENAVTPSFNQAVLTSPVIVVLSASSPPPTFGGIATATSSLVGAEFPRDMLVEFDGPVTVADVAAMKSCDELTLSLRGLVYQPTQFVDLNDNPTSGASAAKSRPPSPR